MNKLLCAVRDGCAPVPHLFTTASKGFLRHTTIAALQAKIAREPYADVYRRMEARARLAFRLARESGFTKGPAALAWSSITPKLPEAALMVCLKDDPDALVYLEEAIAAVDRAARPPAGPDGKPPRLPALSFGDIALAADMCRSRLSPATRQTLLQLMREICIDYHQGAEPYTTYGGGGNIPLCQTLNAAWCALLWGEDCGHPDWRATIDHGIMYTRCYLQHGCDAQGFGYEGTGYSHTVFHYIFLFAELLANCGYANLYDAEPRLRRLVDASLAISFPGGERLMNLNDIGLFWPKSMNWLLYTSRRYNDPLHLGFWYAYQGPQSRIRPYGDGAVWLESWSRDIAPFSHDGTMPQVQTLLFWDAAAPYTPLSAADRPLAQYSPGTEHVNLRTSWGPDAVYVNLAGAGRSHASQTHRHADSGHFSIFAHGEYLAIDTGRYNVDEDQHSVVLVDGRCHLPSCGWGRSPLAGRCRKFETCGLLSYACMDAAQLKNCYWADRHFLFVPLGNDDCYLVIFDSINRDDNAHAFWWQMQGNPDGAFTLDGDRRASFACGQARLDLAFAIPTPGTYPMQPHTIHLRQDEQTWGLGRDKKLEDTRLERTCGKRPRLIAEVTGLNGIIGAVAVPRRQGQQALTVRQRPLDWMLWLEIDTGTGTDTVIGAFDHGCVNTPEIQALSEMVLVRRDRTGLVLDTWAPDNTPVRAEFGSSSFETNKPLKGN